MKELIYLRTETSKTYDLGGGKRHLEICLKLPDGRVKVDPTWQVGTGADDGYRNLATLLLYTTASVVQIGKHYIYLVQHVYEGFMRFTDVTIPQGAIIDNAYLTFRADAAMAGTTVNLIIKAEDADNPSAVTSYDDYTNRSKTSGVAWSNVPAWTKDVDYNSPQIKTEIQTIVDRAGWASGNAIQIFVMDNGSSSGVANCYRRGYSYEGSTTYAPKLVIEYTVVSARKSSFFKMF